MIEKLIEYKELLLKLESEKKLLKEFENICNKSQEEFINNEKNINNLNKEITNIENHIHKIIKLKLKKVNKYLKIPYTLILIIITIALVRISNLDIGIIFAGLISSLLCIAITNNTISNILTKRYKKKNKTIIELQKEIYDKTLELFEYRKNKTIIFNKKVQERINYNNQRHKVQELKRQIEVIKINYATPIFNEEMNKITDKPLTRIKLPNSKN